jgi:predicted N-formylglutamate amidohydrolase
LAEDYKEVSQRPGKEMELRAGVASADRPALVLAALYWRSYTVAAGNLRASGFNLPFSRPREFDGRLLEAGMCYAAGAWYVIVFFRGNLAVEQAVPISPQGDADGPVELIEGNLAAGVLFLCDHAANALPSSYGTLGLAKEQLSSHIAYDIGAAWITRHLAGVFGAPAILSRFSRLLIDPNRGAGDPTLVMRLSDGHIIPGNARAGAAEIENRRAHYWRPYRSAIATAIDAMLGRGPPPAVVSIHTFTPAWKSRPRPWEVGILWDSDPRFAKPLIAALASEGLCVGDNEPYDGALRGDTLDEEVTRRGLAGLLIEIRQDLAGTKEEAAAFAGRLAPLLRPVLARPGLHCKAFFPSRTGRHV